MNELWWIEILVLNSNTCNHLTIWEQMINSKYNYSCWKEMFENICTWEKHMSSGLVKNVKNEMFTKHIFDILGLDKIM